MGGENFYSRLTLHPALLYLEIHMLSNHLKQIALALFFAMITGSVAGCTVAATLRTAVKSQPQETSWTPLAWQEYLTQGPTGRALPDFSSAGYMMGKDLPPNNNRPVFNVTAPEFGAHPDDGADDTAAIQMAVDAAGAAGGGIVLLPKGRYDIRTTGGDPFLELRKDKVILRGQGAGLHGTVLHLGTVAPDGPIRRLGSVPAETEARHHAAVSVLGNETASELAVFTASVKRGERLITVSDTHRLTPGQVIVIECTDPLIDPQMPAPEKTDLSAQLTTPFRLTAPQHDTFGTAALRHSWIARIEKVIDARTILLTGPARFDQPLRYNPRILSFNGVRGIGIEHLRISSNWPGGYRHHKPFSNADGTILRSAKEQDYLWGGVWISNAVDSWVHDVTFDNLTQGIITSHAAYLTLSRLRFTGHDGHAGVTMGWSNDILLEKADFYARLVHPVTLTMMACGNVVSHCVTHYEGRDILTGTDTAIDFHGMFAYENLLENLDGFYIMPGGDLSVLPHGGVRNVFWNITAPVEIGGYSFSDEASFVWSYDYQSTSTASPATMHEHFPQAFFMGIVRKAGKLTIGGSDNDRRSPWMTVEGLNRPGINPPSLYKAQKTIRPHYH